VLETGEYSPEKALTIMKQMKEEVFRRFPSTEDSSLLKNYLDAMPPRYFLANDTATILQHFEIVKKLPEDGVIFHHQPIPQQNINQILIYSLNTPKLFEQVTGVMAANQVNIWNLDVYRNSKGEVLLILMVTDHRGQYIDEDRKIQTLQHDFKNIVQRKVELEKYLQLRRSQGFLPKRAAPEKPPRVEIDNDVSAYYTVIDIYANDRVGLLYDLACSMANQGLYTEVSKISTKVDQIADVFYVKDIFGHKITDKKKIAAIKKTFIDLLSPAPSPLEGEGVPTCRNG
jgi:[protein-PII] uridylyltransferase